MVEKYAIVTKHNIQNFRSKPPFQATKHLNGRAAYK